MKKCIRYYVDPALLNLGVPVEKLEKQRYEVYEPKADWDEEYFNPSKRRARARKSNSALFDK